MLSCFALLNLFLLFCKNISLVTEQVFNHCWREINSPCYNVKTLANRNCKLFFIVSRCRLPVLDIILLNGLIFANQDILIRFIWINMHPNVVAIIAIVVIPNIIQIKCHQKDKKENKKGKCSNCTYNKLFQYAIIFYATKNLNISVKIALHIIANVFLSSCNATT